MSAIAKEKPLQVQSEDRRFLIHEVSWKLYETFLTEMGDRANVRLTYDRGSLEFMTTSRQHEAFAYLIGMFVTLLGMELNVGVKSGRTATLRRKKLLRGLEADNCYWIQSEGRIQRRKRMDLERDPAPDLAIEVTITTSMLDRWAIYAALGVLEIWEYDGVTLRCHVLASSGKYRPAKHSLAFPSLQPADLMPFIDLGMDKNDTAAAKAFVKWVREDLLHKDGR